MLSLPELGMTNSKPWNSERLPPYYVSFEEVHHGVDGID